MNRFATLMGRSLIFSLVFVISSNLTAQNEKEHTIIPKPRSIVHSGGNFELTKGTKIAYTKEAKGLAEYLASFLESATGFNLALEEIKPKERRVGAISLRIIESSDYQKRENYSLRVSSSLISLSAGDLSGIFMGIQTIRQLLPPQIESSEKTNSKWLIPSVILEDSPKYAYRGAMLDVARHFFEVDEVKQFIDYLAMYKMNHLHLHLADDQGWRIEIEAWPKLTSHGGKTEVGGGKGGFYTQEQYKEIVKYASNRFITIVPEIDMPGHTNAALSSYAELNCDGKATELYTGTKVGFSSLCTDKEITYTFIKDVLTELAALTPGPYLHIGGDESHATEKEDYLKFVNRVQGIVRETGKEMIGWDETAQANLTSGSVTQLWANEKFAREAVSKGAKLIMSPAKRAYLDMQYDSTTQYGLHWASYIEVDHGFTWNPATYIEGIGTSDILGIEAPLWSETVTNIKEVEYMLFPRLAGYAEIGWSDHNVNDWMEYRKRLAHQGKRWDVMKINFYRSPKVEWSPMTAPAKR